MIAGFGERNEAQESRSPTQLLVASAMLLAQRRALGGAGGNLIIHKG